MASIFLLVQFIIVREYGHYGLRYWTIFHSIPRGFLSESGGCIFFFKFCSMKTNEETYASHILTFFDFWSCQKQTEIASFNICKLNT